MTDMSIGLEPLKKYAEFKGRASRAEYWWYTLFIMIAAIFIQVALGEGAYALFTLATLLPSLGVMARRLHDINRSGWWMMILFLPIIGLLVFLYFTTLKGTVGANRFGEDPLAVQA